MLERIAQISDDEACSHGQCRKTWRVMMAQAGRQLPLCIDCTEQLVELRKHDKAKEKGKGVAGDKFAARCHRVKALEA